MLQRIQTVYLLLAGVALILTATAFAVWKTPEGISFYARESEVMLGGWLIAIVAVVISITSFKKRVLQMRINTFNMIYILLYGIVILTDVYPFFELPESAQLHIAAFTPFTAIFFLALANKGIRKDENLIRSVDRIR